MQRLTSREYRSLVGLDPDGEDMLVVDHAELGNLRKRIKARTVKVKRTRKGKRKKVRDLEAEFATYVSFMGWPAPVPQLMVVPGRKFAFDFAWPEGKILVEIHGATHAFGRHTRGVGFANDREKMNLAQLEGYLVLECTADHLDSGQAYDWLEAALRGAGLL